MKAQIKTTIEVEVKTLSVKAGARYWCNATVNGVEDTEGTLIPFRDGEYWCPEIDIDNGVIKDWPAGTTAEIHYKVCDDGTYILRDESGKEVAKKEGYVPNIMSPGDNGYGDYIIMTVDETGKIQDWEIDIDDLICGEDD